MASISQELREAALQAAIQGKLTEQLPEDGDARELLAQIKAEKERLVKEKKIKKEKPLAPISEDDVPFDIPGNWTYVRLGDLFSLINGDRGKNYPSKDKLHESGTIPFISAVNMENMTVKEEGVLFVDENQFNALGSGKLQKNDFVFCLRGSLGKFCKYPYDKGAIASSLVILRKNWNISDGYISAYLGSPLIVSQIHASDNGTAQPNLGARDIAKYIIPLPPLAEQHRIVARVEELMAKIDELEKVENELKALHQAFPGDMETALLQAAMQGKLTEQLPEDGNAEDLLKQIKAEKERLVKEKKIKKEKPLTPISEDEVPFDIPENWQWVRLQDVCTKIVDGDHNPPSGTSMKTEYYMLSAQNINNNTVSIEPARYLTQDVFLKENERTRVTKGDIFFTIVGTLGRSCVYDANYNVCFQRSVSVIATLLFNKYLKYVFDNGYIQQFMSKNATGTAQKGFYLNQVAMLLIPVPPLAEQYRVVERLEKLLPLCDSLQTEL